MNFPKQYVEYRACGEALDAKEKTPKKLFPKSVFPCATVNLGPRTCCRGHRDSGNRACGQCVITAAGNYDHTKRGHLVLHEFKLIIQFPSGSTALIPSATVTHSNVPIAANEERFSVTQYAAGGLFRWVEYNHMTEDEFERTDRRGWAATTSPEACRNRVAAGLSSFSKYSELLSDLKAAFPGDSTP
jgi:hypothetical protein